MCGTRCGWMAQVRIGRIGADIGAAVAQLERAVQAYIHSHSVFVFHHASTYAMHATMHACMR